MKPSKASRKHIEAIKLASADDLKRYAPQTVPYPAPAKPATPPTDPKDAKR